MKYIIIVLLGFSLPAVALDSRSFKTSEHTSSLLKNIYKNIEKPCDPEKSLHMPPFN